MKRRRVLVKGVAVLIAAALILSGCSKNGASEQTISDAEQSIFGSAQTSSATAESTDGTAESTDGTAKYSSLFKKDNVIDINIEMDQADWAALLADATAEEYYSADVTIDGMKVSNAGVRAKGSSSLTAVAGSDSDRYSLRVKFDKYVDDQNLLGLDELVLNNCYNDPSYMREYLTYEAFRELGAHVPLTAYSNIYINGELFGFYLCVEDVDDSFLEREFGSNDGNLYKAGEGSTLSADKPIDSFSLKNGDDEEMSNLQYIADSLNTMPEGEKGEIESVLDVDSALMYFAVNTMLGSYDSYQGKKAQNFFIYENNNICTVIPWDYNMSFGGFPADGGTSTVIPMDEPVFGVTTDSRPLVSKLLAVDEYLQKYHRYIETLTDYLAGLPGRTGTLSNIVRPHIQADPSSFYTMEEFDYAVSRHEDQEKAVIGNPGGMPINSIPVSILDYAADRLHNILQQLSGELPTVGNTTAIAQFFPNEGKETAGSG